VNGPLSQLILFAYYGAIDALRIHPVSFLLHLKLLLGGLVSYNFSELHVIITSIDLLTDLVR
jgi:hypothetical protein